MGDFVFLTGGARSGKSAFAVRMARGRTAFIATCVPRDPEMQERVRLHQQSRPREWETHVEERDLVNALRRVEGRVDTAIVDCMTLFVANCFMMGEGEGAILNRVRALIDRIAAGPLRVIVVSNEVGMGVVPENEMGRVFRDVAGRVNQLLAARAAEVHLLVAGIPLKLKGE